MLKNRKSLLPSAWGVGVTVTLFGACAGLPGKTGCNTWCNTPRFFGKMMVLHIGIKWTAKVVLPGCAEGRMRIPIYMCRRWLHCVINEHNSFEWWNGANVDIACVNVDIMCDEVKPLWTLFMSVSTAKPCQPTGWQTRHGPSTSQCP